MATSNAAELRLIETGASSWTVREIDNARTPGATTPSSLICDSTSMVRRLWTFPAGWRALPDRALLALFGIA